MSRHPNQELLDAIRAAGEAALRLHADNERLRIVGAAHQYDPLRVFAEGQAEGDCTYGDGCPPEANHYRCVSCLARLALREAALRDLQQESERFGLYDTTVTVSADSAEAGR